MGSIKRLPLFCTSTPCSYGGKLCGLRACEVMTPLESANLPCSYCIPYCISSGEGVVFFFQTVGDNCLTGDTRKRGYYNSTRSPGTKPMSPSSVQELLPVWGDVAFPSSILELYFWWGQVRGVYNSLNYYLTLLWSVEQALFAMSSLL